MRFANYTAVAVSLLFTADLAAQTTPPAASCGHPIDLTSSTLSDARRSLQRALTLTNVPHRSDLFRSSSMGQTACAGSFTFLEKWLPATRDSMLQLLPVEASVLTNSAYPRSVNDGPVWSGVGTNFRASGGVHAHWRFLRASLAPEIAYQQNETFDFVRYPSVALSEFADPYHQSIDYPTRFGSEAKTTSSFGQSYIQASAGRFAATFSSENVWIGAAEVYPILMSYTAPGFPHLRVGTQAPLDLPFVRLELQLLFGSLDESDYFNNNPEDNKRFFATSMLVIEPKFVPGLFLGVARAYHDSADATGQPLSFYTSRLITTPFGGTHGGNSASENAIGLLLARWVHPASGFEAYAEWSREDTPGGWIDVLREPDWTQAYVLGFQKVFPSPNRLVRFYGELIHLGESAPARSGRGFFSYYTHSTVAQGHTHKGQLLGAAIGPGSDAQLLGIDVFTGSGRSAFRVERTRYDDDTYYRTFARRWGETRHDAEITLSASRLHFFGPFEAEAGIAWSRRYNRQFLTVLREEEQKGETNLSLRAFVAWRPPSIR